MRAEGWGWRHASRRAWALQDLNLRIEPGERVLLLGASGSGKSTLLRGLAGVLGGDDEGEQTGELLIGGMSADSSRGQVGLVLQDPDAQVILARVGDDVAFGCENLGVPREQIWPRVHQALDAVGLRVPLDRSTQALSGGQKQRLALAGALAMRPGLLLLDEPTANLDPAGVAEVRDAVAGLLHGHPATLIVVEHRVEAWLPLVDRVIVLGAPEEGVIADGAPERVLSECGADLAARGVWVPEHPPAMPAAPRTGPGEVLLRARGLAVGRPRRGGASPGDADVAADGIEATVAGGSALALTGVNGAGKSTLALTLSGLAAPIAGTVAASEGLASGAGSDPLRWSSRQLLTRIGSVFQNPEHQLLSSTVRAELEVGPRALGLAAGDRDRRVDELLERLRLTELAQANPFTLSGGQKRRLTVAAALATRPRVLVLDEPTFGQDARTWAELVALLAELRDAGSAIVVATHDADVVRGLAARVLELGR